MQVEQLKLPKPFNLQVLARYLTPKTIMSIIADMERAIDNRWSIPPPELTQVRDTLVSYMAQVWPSVYHNMLSLDIPAEYETNEQG